MLTQGQCYELFQTLFDTSFEYKPEIAIPKIRTLLRKELDRQEVARGNSRPATLADSYVSDVS